MVFAYTILAVLSVIVIGAIVPTTILLVRILLTQLAERDILYTFCAEGEIKFIMDGESLKRMIMRVKGKRLRVGDSLEKYEIVNATEEDENKIRWWQIRKRLKSLGIYWVGFPPSRVFVYKFKWGKPIGEGASISVQERDEWVDSLRFQYTYGIEAKGIEIKGTVGVDIFITLLIEARNPYQAVLIQGGTWFEAIVLPRILGAINRFVQGLKIEDFQREISGAKDTVSMTGNAKETLIDMIMGEASEVFAQTGMMPIKANFSHYSLVTNEEVEKAAQSAEVERLKALGVEAEARGRANAIIDVGEAVAWATRQFVEAGGGYSGQIKLAEAIANFKGGTLVVGGQASTLVGNDSKASQN